MTSSVYDRQIIGMRFNQDQTCFTISTQAGFRVFNLEPLAELMQYEVDVPGGIKHVEMLNRSSMFAIISGGSMPKFPENMVKIFDDNRKEGDKFVYELTFGSNVCNVRLRHDKLIVMLPDKLYIYSFPDNMELLQCFNLTGRQRKYGLCEVSPTLEREIMAIPGSHPGSFEIIDFEQDRNRRSSTPSAFTAHRTRIYCIAINHSGTMVATASVKGTIIRVFFLPCKQPKHEFRRGSDTAKIYSLCFSKDSEYLCCSSDKGTVHIYSIANPSLNITSRLSGVSGSLLSPYAKSMWGFAKFTVRSECGCICTFGPDNTIYAICDDGSYHKYVFYTDRSQEKACERKGYDMYIDIGDQMNM